LERDYFISQAGPSNNTNCRLLYY